MRITALNLQTMGRGAGCKVKEIDRKTPAQKVKHLVKNPYDVNQL